MTDLEPILALWRDLVDSRTEYVLGTVVLVEGSGYRKPGARILIAADGRRAGTISGGCLEGEVARKAFWYTEHGPVVRRYSTTAEDGEVPYGMGCGGVVDVLLERSATAAPVLERLAADFAERRALAIATVLDGPQMGARGYFPSGSPGQSSDELLEALAGLALGGFEQQRSSTRTMMLSNGTTVPVRIEWSSARPGLFLFGAGDDAIPLVSIARQLGWYVEVADGRANLATRARFPEANAVRVLDGQQVFETRLHGTDSAVLMTHSLEQDVRILAELLPQDAGYIGVLGPRRRTADILLLIAEGMAVAPVDLDATIAGWMAQLHAPIGLDLGGETPADIALAIMAEMQQCLRRASGLSLKVVRGDMKPQPVAARA